MQLDESELRKNADLLSTCFILFQLFIVIPHPRTEGKFISPPSIIWKTSLPDSAAGFNSCSCSQPGQKCVSTGVVTHGAFHISGVLLYLTQLLEASNTSSRSRSYIIFTIQLLAVLLNTNKFWARSFNLSWLRSLFLTHCSIIFSDRFGIFWCVILGQS